MDLGNVRPDDRSRTRRRQGAQQPWTGRARRGRVWAGPSAGAEWGRVGWGQPVTCPGPSGGDDVLVPECELSLGEAGVCEKGAQPPSDSNGARKWTEDASDHLVTVSSVRARHHAPCAQAGGRSPSASAERGRADDRGRPLAGLCLAALLRARCGQGGGWVRPGVLATPRHTKGVSLGGLADPCQFTRPSPSVWAAPQPCSQPRPDLGSRGEEGRGEAGWGRGEAAEAAAHEARLVTGRGGACGRPSAGPWRLVTSPHHPEAAGRRHISGERGC